MIALTVEGDKKEVPAAALRANWYQSLANATRKEGYSLPKTLGIALVLDVTMRSVNKQTRGLDRVTDVLSFSYGHDEGELLIAPAQARRQFKTFKSASVKDEIKRLVIHGYLHLAGLDHIKNKERKIMEEATSNILSLVRKI